MSMQQPHGHVYEQKAARSACLYARLPGSSLAKEIVTKISRRYHPANSSQLPKLLSAPRTRRARAAQRRAQAGASVAMGAQAVLLLQREQALDCQQLPQHLGCPGGRTLLTDVLAQQHPSVLLIINLT